MIQIIILCSQAFEQGMTFMARQNISTTPASGAAALAYWERKSLMYPTPGDSRSSGTASGLRERAAALGVRFDVSAILDAGAGTGVHAVALASMARKVVAVDLSPAMLAPLIAIAPPHVTVLAADFITLDLDAQGWHKAFDLVWCCMTPVSGDAEGLLQLERASRDQICCVTWGPNRQDPLFAEAFGLHGAEFQPPAWREAIIAHARRHGRQLRHDVIAKKTVQYIEPAALADELTHHLRWLGVEPDPCLLEDWSRSKARDGLVERVLDADQEIWLWSVESP